MPGLTDMQERLCAQSRWAFSEMQDMAACFGGPRSCRRRGGWAIDSATAEGAFDRPRKKTYDPPGAPVKVDQTNLVD